MSAITIVALIISVACIADYYHNNSKVELIPPGSTSPYIIGEVEVDGQTMEISNQYTGSGNISHAGFSTYYTDGNELVSKINFDIYTEDMHSYYSHYLNIDKYTTLPIGSERITESKLIKDSVSSIHYQLELNYLQSQDYCIYSLEKDGVQYESYVDELQDGRMRVDKILCGHTSPLLKDNSEYQIGRFQLLMSLYITMCGTYGVPVDGKAVGPWSYDMTENSTGAQATLNIECVSPYRAVGDANHYILNDKDASKMCKVTLSNEDEELIDPCT